MARIRTFIAIAIESFVQDKLTSMQQKLAREAPDVRWVPEENRHLTLHFLGEVPELDLVGICRVVERVTGRLEPFRVEIRGLGAFPTPRRPRTLFAAITEGAESLKILHAALEDELVELGGYRREVRDYSPHITLGRVQVSEENEDLPALMLKHAKWDGGGIAVKEVLVMSSELERKGPTYMTVGRGRLRGS